MMNEVFPPAMREPFAGSVLQAPTEIPGLVLWLDALHVAGLNDGDPVTTWSDLSGNGQDVTQATASKKPVYKVNIVNGRPVVRFDGTDDFLQNLTLTQAQPLSIFFVLNNRVYVSEDRIMDGSVGNVLVINQYVNSPEMSIYAGTAFVTESGELPVDTFGLFYGLFNGASSELRINGGAATTGNPGVNGFDAGITIGAAVAGTVASAVDVAAVVVYGSALSAANRQRLELYLSTRFGIVLP